MQDIENRPLGAVGVGARHNYFPGVEDAGSTGRAYAIFQMDVVDIVTRSTRHLVADARFAAILNALEDEPQKQAIKICARAEKPRKCSYRLRAANPDDKKRVDLWGEGLEGERLEWERDPGEILDEWREAAQLLKGVFELGEQPPNNAFMIATSDVL